MNTTVPTQLIIGSPDLIVQHAEEQLRRAWCKEQQENCFCIDCRKISSRQHPLLIWIKPEKSYSIEDITVIFDITKFARDDNETFFFVLEDVQTFNIATANKLLKILEEPPAGYHFILTTNNEKMLLPTIISRSHLVRLNDNQSATQHHPLLVYFYVDEKMNDPFGFELELRRQQLSDQASEQLAHELLAYFSEKIVNHYKHHDKKLSSSDLDQTNETIEIIKNALKQPPQSGSSTIFWRNLFLQLS